MKLLTTRSIILDKIYYEQVIAMRSKVQTITDQNVSGTLD